ncbi:protein phosphatase 2C domain-containing protein [Streptomyces sp. NPDC048290]|uniref:protein phosphatase 2C domain-containing protein n=1 Tax=Streptomyces sp. NPDC048290 TaxID=3155811 RepID=UPI003416D718
MSQQGGSPTGHEDDWWGQLYDDSTEDTGPAPAADSLDDRFASASGAVTTDATDVTDATGDTGGTGGTGDPGGAGGTGGTRDPSGPAAPATPAVDPRRPDRARDPRGTTRPPASPPPASPGPPPPPPLRTPAPPAPPPPRPATGLVRQRAPWERPLPTAGGPSTFPPPPPPRRPAPAEPSATPGDTSAPTVVHVGSGPPTYDPEPTALPAADPDDLADLVADTVLDGARYGVSTLRAVSVRGDSARYRGEPRRDALLTARFGTGADALVLVAMASGARATPAAHRAAAEACQWIARAVGRSHTRLAEDIRAGRRGDLKSGLHRLTDRSLGKLRAGAADRGLGPDEYAATLRCLLLTADPECRTRVFFGVGAGGLFRLRDGVWQDIEPQITDAPGEPLMSFGSPPAETPEGDRLTMDLNIPTPPSPYEPAPERPREPFRFRASVARPGDTLLMCTHGLAEPLHGEPELTAHLTARWSGAAPPGLAAFLADIQTRAKGYADDRTAAAVWEA